MVEGTKNKEWRGYGICAPRNFLAFLEIAGPKDGNLQAYVKKFVLFERKRVYEF